VLAHWNNSLRIDMSHHSDTLSWFCTNQSLLFLLNAVEEKHQIQCNLSKQNLHQTNFCFCDRSSVYMSLTGVQYIWVWQEFSIYEFDRSSVYMSLTGVQYEFNYQQRFCVLVFIYSLLSRNESWRFGALKSDSTHHFFRNACTKSGSLRFQFSGCWLILSVYIL
jgi:hypothetical protein